MSTEQVGYLTTEQVRVAVRDRQLRDMLLRAIQQGFRARRCGNHLMLLPPNPAFPPLVFASTPSDHRALRNARAHLRRAGYKE